MLADLKVNSYICSRIKWIMATFLLITWILVCILVAFAQNSNGDKGADYYRDKIDRKKKEMAEELRKFNKENEAFKKIMRGEY